ncbi:hypothetical protein GRI69_11785 [Erythrobacter vulgaris]|uniref:Lipoprotein n=1 Tax=Qipengyuania vulgaris TaxID=291985 RepID=A0A844XVE8_9SPHN|nr:hypothetical protein [Qipengyuania vulgaris]MXO48938.1 hypothetical protein [Qipengyuania vulgaris]
MIKVKGCIGLVVVGVVGLGGCSSEEAATGAVDQPIPSNSIALNCAHQEGSTQYVITPGEQQISEWRPIERELKPLCDGDHVCNFQQDEYIYGVSTDHDRYFGTFDMSVVFDRRGGTFHHRLSSGSSAALAGTIMDLSGTCSKIETLPLEELKF